MFKFSTVVTKVEGAVKGLFDKVVKTGEGAAIEAGVEAFIKTDVGVIFLDGVQYASTLPQGTSADAARAAAKDKIKADLKTAGHDLEALGEATLNLFLEMAYTYAGGLVAKLATATLHFG